jgi:hypothetical protein
MDAEDENDELEGLTPVAPAYKGSWKQFTKYVNDELGGPVQDAEDADKYLTRANVNAYFKHHIPTLKIQPDGIVRHRTALQWYSTHREWKDPDNPFIVNSKTVKDCIKLYASKYLMEYTIRNHDAHAGLPTNILSDEDHCKAMKHVISTNDSTWQDFGMSWNGCRATNIRQATLRKLFLCHLRADASHGPPGASPNNRTILSLIMEPGTRKDDSAENRANQPHHGVSRGRKAPMQYKKRVVAVYRHKNFLQCFTGLVGMSILTRFHDSMDLSFLQPVDKKMRPLWQKEHLLSSWRTHESCDEVYRRVMGTCEISWAKMTHLRSCGMEHASASGLPADMIATMSKHRGERLFDAYMTELFPEVMLVMSGHRPKDSYFVPRTEIEEFPYSMDECIKKLFPHYDRWVGQLKSRRGDKHESAKNFLFKLLPFLTRVIFQDAPYWLKFFPNHTFSRFLSNRLPYAPFRQWCEGAIIKAKSISDQLAINEVSTLNEAAR